LGARIGASSISAVRKVEVECCAEEGGREVEEGEEETVAEVEVGVAEGGGLSAGRGASLPTPYFFFLGVFFETFVHSALKTESSQSLSKKTARLAATVSTPALRQQAVRLWGVGSPHPGHGR